MPLLLEITFFVLAGWADTADVGWADTGDVAWASPGDTTRVSDRDFADVHQWDGRIVSMTPPSFQMEKNHGGYCRLGFGSVELSLDLFADLGIWPPPKKMSGAFYWTPDAEASRELLFISAAHRSGMNRDRVEYDLYGPDLSGNFLDESNEGYGDGVTMETVPLSMALGRVQQERAVRLANVGGKPVYHKGWIAGSLCGDFLYVESGTGGRARFVCSTFHGLSIGDRIIIEGDNNEYDNNGLSWEVYATPYVNVFEIDAPFNQTAGGWFFSAGTWPLRVYNSGIPFTDVTDSGVETGPDATITMNSTPTGEITLSGTGYYADLIGVANRVAGALDLYLNISSAKSPSPSVSKWVDAQVSATDLLSEACAWFEHIFYIETWVGLDKMIIQLIDMDADNESATLTEYGHTAPEYSDEAPVALLKSSWSIRKATEDSEGGKYVDDQAKEASVSSQYGYGNEQSLDPYQAEVADVETRLSSILERIHMPRVKISIPLSSGLPKPGKRFTISDTGPKQAVSSVFHARNITYSFEAGREQATVSGEGKIS